MRNQYQGPGAARPVMANGGGMGNMGMTPANMGMAPMGTMDWSGEINGQGQQVIPYDDPAALQEQNARMNGAGQGFVEPNRHANVDSALSDAGSYLDMLNRAGQVVPQAPDMTHGLSSSVIGDPQTNQEVYLGSMKAALQRNIGNFIVATFLIGTQGTVSWEGILYSVGNDYITIYQVARDRYIVCDLYSLKYTEFYDTRRRARCNELLAEQNYGTAE